MLKPKIKSVTKVDTYYSCPVCGLTSTIEEVVLRCINSHKDAIAYGCPGEYVKFDDGYDGGQLGHDAGWWPNVTSYLIIRNDAEGRAYLFERPDGTRDWVSYAKTIAIQFIPMPKDPS